MYPYYFIIHEVLNYYFLKLFMINQYQFSCMQLHFHPGSSLLVPLVLLYNQYTIHSIVQNKPRIDHYPYISFYIHFQLLCYFLDQKLEAKIHQVHISYCSSKGREQFLKIERDLHGNLIVVRNLSFDISFTCFV